MEVGVLRGLISRLRQLALVEDAGYYGIMSLHARSTLLPVGSTTPVVR